MSSGTWRQQDDGGDDQGADDQDHEQRDGDPFPVPLWRVAPHQLLKQQRGRETGEGNPETGRAKSMLSM